MLAATLAALCIALAPAWHVLAAVLVLTHWFFDRADGQLARLQDSATPLGAWLDANLDELADLSMQAAVAYSLFQAHFSHWPITLLVLFLVGKYLFMVGLWLEATAAPAPSSEVGQARNHSSLLHSSYHFLANADVRVHLLALALFAGQLWIQLALVAVYYNVRWLARYLLVVQRLRRAAA
jgi:phosphatidylglycerophosphate synthase